VVICGGANVISKKNTTVAIKHVCNFVEKKGKYCDFIIISCTLILWQIEKKMKICNKCKHLDKKYCTKHGQQLNPSGKGLISIKLTMVIKELFTKKHLSRICLQ
jgi:hypothetical protein